MDASIALSRLVTMLDYGPYASFAPTYNSDHATMSLQDSIRLQRVYGSVRNAEYASGYEHGCLCYRAAGKTMNALRRLKAFVEGTHDSLIRQVDGLLDVVTGGRHSRLMDELMVRMV